jgi:hypothetical protein
MAREEVGTGTGRIRIRRQSTAGRELPPLDLRSPSGKRTLPY